MKGPSDISGLLSGLRTKEPEIIKQDKSSTISIQELKELQNTNKPL